MRLPWLILLYLASCASTSVENDTDEILIGAIELLESKGVKNLDHLCHDDSTVLPPCQRPATRRRRHLEEGEQQQQEIFNEVQHHSSEKENYPLKENQRRARRWRARYLEEEDNQQQQKDQDQEEDQEDQRRARQGRYLEEEDNQQEEKDEDQEEEEEQDDVPTILWFDAWNVLGAVLCVFVSSIAAGLTVSLLSLDPLVLLVKMRASDDEKEKKQAARLVTIVKRRHLLLVSLILCTTVSSEALPIFLQDLMPRYVAILVAVVLVLVFGEVLPTIIFTGPNQLAIASRWAPVVKCIICLLYPIAAPIAKLLDHLHHDKEMDAGNMYNRGELAALIRIQYEERMAFHQRKQHDLSNKTGESPNLASSLRALKGEFNRNYPEGGLPSIASDEINMVEGALQMKMKVAMDVYCPLDKVFGIPSDTILDEASVVRIYGSAYSRIPVYERRQDDNDKRNIRGIFMTRQLIVVKPEKEVPLSSLRMNVPFCISPKTNLVDLVSLFQTGASGGKGGHMALVCARPDVGNAALDRNEAIPDEAILMG